MAFTTMDVSSIGLAAADSSPYGDNPSSTTLHRDADGYYYFFYLDTNGNIEVFKSATTSGFSGAENATLLIDDADMETLYAEPKTPSIDIKIGTSFIHVAYSYNDGAKRSIRYAKFSLAAALTWANRLKSDESSGVDSVDVDTFYTFVSLDIISSTSIILSVAEPTPGTTLKVYTIVASVITEVGSLDFDTAITCTSCQYNDQLLITYVGCSQATSLKNNLLLYNGTLVNVSGSAATKTNTEIAELLNYPYIQVLYNGQLTLLGHSRAVPGGKDLKLIYLTKHNTFLELRRPISLFDTTLGFVDNNLADDTLTDSRNRFISAGFLATNILRVDGSTNNDDYVTIDTVAAGVLTLDAADTLTTESAGELVTLSKVDIQVATSHMGCTSYGTPFVFYVAGTTICYDKSVDITTGIQTGCLTWTDPQTARSYEQSRAEYQAIDDYFSMLAFDGTDFYFAREDVSETGRIMASHELTINGTAYTSEVIDFDVDELFDAPAELVIILKNPQLLNFGGDVTFTYGLPNRELTFNGLVTERNTNSKELICNDYLVILSDSKNTISEEDIIRLEGLDMFYVVKELITLADTGGKMNLSRIKGTPNNRFLRASDAIYSDNPMEIVLRALALVTVEGTNKQLQSHIWIEDGTFVRVEVEADPDDEATYPSFFTAQVGDGEKLIDLTIRPNQRPTYSSVTGFGKEVCITETSEFMKEVLHRDRRTSFEYATENTDTLQDMAISTLDIGRDINDTPEIQARIIDAFGVRLNQILTIISGDMGVDGRYRVGGKQLTGGLRATIALGAKPVLLTDKL